MSRFKEEIIGERFGKLLVLKPRIKEGKRKRLAYTCVCDCGGSKVVTRDCLRGGYTNSCGCLYKENGRRQGIANRFEYGQSALNALYTSYKYTAEQRNLVFELTKKEFKKLTKGNCFYCGIEPKNTYGHKGQYGKYTHNGIDRVDNNLGYLLINCVSACKRCNQAKNNMTFGEFMSWTNKVYNYNILFLKVDRRAH